VDCALITLHCDIQLEVGASEGMAAAHSQPALQHQALRPGFGGPVVQDVAPL